MIKNDDVKLNEGILLILVHNATNVPSTDRFRGLPDPYVNIFYLGSSERNEKRKNSIGNQFSFLLEGIKKQTNWQRSTCDPTWNEVSSIIFHLVFNKQNRFRHSIFL